MLKVKKLLAMFPPPYPVEVKKGKIYVFGPRATLVSDETLLDSHSEAEVRRVIARTIAKFGLVWPLAEKESCQIRVRDTGGLWAIQKFDGTYWPDGGDEPRLIGVFGQMIGQFRTALGQVRCVLVRVRVIGDSRSVVEFDGAVIKDKDLC